MNGVGERKQVRPALIGPSLRMNGVSEKGRVKERETETETERDQTGGVQQSLANLYFLP